MKNYLESINLRWYLPAVILATAIAICLAAGLAHAGPDDTAIVNAIYRAEGGLRAHFFYGIRSVKYTNIAEARRICFNTVRNNRKRYTKYGYKHYPDFLSFLASRYCPVKGNLSRAEKRLNGNWLRNIRYFLALNGRKG